MNKSFWKGRQNLIKFLEDCIEKKRKCMAMDIIDATIVLCWDEQYGKK